MIHISYLYRDNRTKSLDSGLKTYLSSVIKSYRIVNKAIVVKCCTLCN